MGHFFDSGMFVRTPAWHKLGNVLQDWPGTFEEARQQAGLTWEVTTSPVYVADGVDTVGGITFDEVPGWQLLRRDDTRDILSIQSDSYAVIGNGEFGNIIEYVMNGDIPGSSNLKFETLISLHGGKQIISTMYLDEPIAIPGDNSETYPYMVFISRHDGRGGLRLGPTAVRVVCANTQAMAERQMDKHGFSYTIRHTSNWADRIGQARTAVAGALSGFKHWEGMAKDLAKQAFSERDVEDFLDKWLPYSTAQTDKQRENTDAKRRQFKHIYMDSPTCETIVGTKWGALQAAIELCDHFTKSQNIDTEVSRVLGRTDERKDKALALITKF